MGEAGKVIKRRNVSKKKDEGSNSLVLWEGALKNLKSEFPP